MENLPAQKRKSIDKFLCRQNCHISIYTKYTPFRQEKLLDIFEEVFSMFTLSRISAADELSVCSGYRLIAPFMRVKEWGPNE